MRSTAPPWLRSTDKHTHTINAKSATIMCLSRILCIFFYFFFLLFAGLLCAPVYIEKNKNYSVCPEKEVMHRFFFIFSFVFLYFFFIISWSPLHTHTYTHTHSENVIWFISRRKHRVLFCFSNCVSFVIGRCCYNYCTYSRAHCAAWSWTYAFGIKQRAWISFSFNCQLNIFLLGKMNMVRAISVDICVHMNV